MEVNKIEKSFLSQDTISDCGVQTQDACVQTEVIQRDYVPMSILKQFNLESEAYPHFIYRSHTITGLFIAIVLVFIGQNYYTHETGPNSIMLNGHIGMYFSFLIFATYAVIYFPNTIMQRPHPAFWRLVHAVGIFWLAMVTFVNFYSKEDLQKFLKIAVDDNLGKPLAEKSYAEECDFYTPGHPNGNFANITGAVDIFFAAHVTGWAFKMLITRDFKLCMLQSIIFELIEVTFRHWLNNFYECWWDSIILDLILCNTGGMLIGMLIIKSFNLKKYKWSMRKKNDKSYIQNLKEAILPINLVEHHWEMLSSTKRFLSVSFFVVLFQSIDISFFFNKFVLHIETNHRLCVIRTFMIGFLSMPAAREYYEFITDKNVKRLGPYCWNLIAILIVEFFLFFNNADWSKFQEPFPWYVKLIWMVFGVIYLLVLSVVIFNDIKKKIQQYKNKKQQVKQKKEE